MPATEIQVNDTVILTGTPGTWTVAKVEGEVVTLKDPVMHSVRTYASPSDLTVTNPA